ncbi:MAG: PorP/SprF family type IX secretion system membrane protein [Bacteroidota bacterium]
MMKRSTLFAIAFLMLTALSAQDKHFTQFYASPLTLNPALTGAYNGRFRVASIYRDQWRGALESPYVTFASAVDVRWDVEFDSRYKDAFAIGLLFFNDKVGGIDFSTNQLALSAAFHKGLDYDKKQFLSLGIQGGLAQRNINYEDLTFDDQFNDINSFDQATRENLPENNFSFSDFNVGLNYTFTPKQDMSFFAGLALHHFLQPQLSFYSEEDGGDSKLYMKISGQLSAQVPLSDRVSIIPRALFAQQGPHLEINVGSNLRYKLTDYNGNALQFGSWVRPVTTEDESFAIDALIVMFGFEIGSVLVGASYDINLDDVSTFKQGQNAIEFSLTYLGSYDDESILCPSF